jgi:hypothetical protein
MKSPFYFFFFTDLDKGFFALDFWVLTTDFLDGFFFDAAADAFFFDDEVEVLFVARFAAAFIGDFCFRFVATGALRGIR